VFHDLRDTGLTHMAVRGDSPIAIQWAGGHTDFKTAQGYLDRGKVEARRIGSPLPPLPPGIVPESPRTITAKTSNRNNSVILRPQRELKPKKRHFLCWRCRSSFVTRFRESHDFPTEPASS
jgi:hypothetical protein